MTLATKLTFSRLLLAPVIFILFWILKYNVNPSVDLWMTLTLIGIAAYGEISDALDGKIARDRNEITDFGKLFDPFADSVYRFTFFFCFWWLKMCPAWMVIVILYREMSISFLRLVLRGENVVLAARQSGKIKAIFQASAIFLILLVQASKYWFRNLTVELYGSVIMFIVVIVTLISMVDYIQAHWKILEQIKK
jgi:CDP-diacylglycerol---glycerol-3-phosphate 3-phosphatidyltransferase